jgi:hypothetical protein
VFILNLQPVKVIENVSQLKYLVYHNFHIIFTNFSEAQIEKNVIYYSCILSFSVLRNFKYFKVVICYL